jgi:hypothetical protein
MWVAMSCGRATTSRDDLLSAFAAARRRVIDYSISLAALACLLGPHLKAVASQRSPYAVRRAAWLIEVQLELIEDDVRF